MWGIQSVPPHFGSVEIDTNSNESKHGRLCIEVEDAEFLQRGGHEWRIKYLPYIRPLIPNYLTVFAILTPISP